MDLVGFLKRTIVVRVSPNLNGLRHDTVLETLADNFPGCPDIALQATLYSEFLSDNLKKWLVGALSGWRCLHLAHHWRPRPPPWWLWHLFPVNSRFTIKREGGQRYGIYRQEHKSYCWAIFDLQYGQLAIMDYPQARDEALAFTGLGIWAGGWRLRWRMPFNVPFSETVLQILKPHQT